MKTRDMAPTSVASAGQRPARRLVAGAVGLALLGAAAGWAVGWSSLLDVRTVEVAGAHRISADEIRTRAAVPLGTPLARLDTAAVRSRLVEIPQIADVAVTRRWPHSVRITVEERQPAAAVPDGERFILVDLEGVSFETVAEKPAGVPLVVGAPPWVPDSQRVHAVVDVLAAVPIDVRKRTVEISARTVDSVTLTLDDGVRIVWGNAAAAARKAEVLTALMRTEAEVYDVSSPDAPTTTG